MNELGVRLGYSGADNLISRAMEELAVQMANAHKAFMRGNTSDVHIACEKVVTVADHIGLTTLHSVAQHAVYLADTKDFTALAAVVARLTRVGETSLMQVWDLEDLSV